MDIIQAIKDKVPPDTVIPKLNARAAFLVKGWGKRRGEEALIYQIPNHSYPARPHEKGITVTEWRLAYQRVSAGENFEPRLCFARTCPRALRKAPATLPPSAVSSNSLGLVDYQRACYVPRRPLPR